MRRVRSRGSVAQTAGWAAALLLLSVSAHAAPSQSLRLNLGLGANWDDNFLEYSDGQISDFDSGAHPDRFSVESVDDVVLEPTVGLTYEKERDRGAGRTIRLRWAGSFQSKNATSDHLSGSFSWQEAFGKDRSLTLNGYLLPNFYLRQLFDEDLPSGTGASRYRRAEFALKLASLAYRQRVLPRTLLSVSYQYERRDYNNDFLERDSDTHETGAGLDWTQRGGRLGFGANGGYRSSNARAADGDDPGGVTPDDADVSYNGVVLGGDGHVDLARGRSGRLSAEAAYELRTRDYLSDRPADRSHFGRKDRLHDLTLGLRWNPPGPFSLRTYYQHENNHASFEALNPPATDPASYSENRIGASVTYGTTLWKR